MGQILGETLRMDSADTYFKLLLRPNIRGGGGGINEKGRGSFAQSENANRTEGVFTHPCIK